jgi:hypothetical protein
MPIISPYKNLSPVAQKTGAGTPISAAFGTPSVSAQALDVLTMEWGFTPSQDVTAWTMTLKDGATVLGTDTGGPATGGVVVTPSILGVDAIDGTNPREITAELDLDGEIIVNPSTFTPFQILPTHYTAGTGSITPLVTMSADTAIFTIDAGTAWNNSGTSVSPGGTAEIIYAIPRWGSSQITGFSLRDCELTSIDSGWDQVDTSGVTSFKNAWRGNQLASFPEIDTSNATDFFATWFENDLVTFPALDFSSALILTSAWGNNPLVSFPTVDTRNVTSCQTAWVNCDLETFPVLDFSSCSNFTTGFTNCDLDSDGVNSILASCVANGLTGGRVDINGGTNAAPTGQGITDKATLQARSWIVNTN